MKIGSKNDVNIYISVLIWNVKINYEKGMSWQLPKKRNMKSSYMVHAS